MLQNQTKICVLVCLLFGCSQNQDTAKQEKKAESLPLPEWEIRTVAEEADLLLQLAANLSVDSVNEVAIGKNRAAEWVLSQGWEMQTTQTGLMYQIVDEGEGKEIAWGDRLVAHYHGTFTDGQVFDSSYRRGKPLTFYVGNMVPGWNEGLQKMRIGSKAVLVLPPHLGYSGRGLRDSNGKELVPPDRVLVFRLEVLSEAPEPGPE